MATCTKPFTYVNNRLAVEGSPYAIVTRLQPSGIVSSGGTWDLFQAPNLFLKNFTNVTCKEVKEGGNTTCVPQSPGSMELDILMQTAMIDPVGIAALTPLFYMQVLEFDGSTTVEGPVVSRTISGTNLPALFSSLSRPIIVSHVPGDNLTRVVTIRLMNKPTKAASVTWVEYAFTIIIDVAECSTNSEEPVCSLPQVFLNTSELTLSNSQVATTIDILNVTTNTLTPGAVSIVYGAHGFDPGLCHMKNGVCTPVAPGNMAGGFLVSFTPAGFALGLRFNSTATMTATDFNAGTVQTAVMSLFGGFGGFYITTPVINVFTGPLDPGNAKVSQVDMTWVDQRNGDVYTASIFYLAYSTFCQ